MVETSGIDGEDLEREREKELVVPRFWISDI